MASVFKYLSILITTGIPRECKCLKLHVKFVEEWVKSLKKKEKEKLRNTQKRKEKRRVA